MIPGEHHEGDQCADEACGDANEEREVNYIFEQPGDEEHNSDKDRERHDYPEYDVTYLLHALSFISCLLMYKNLS